MQGEDLASLNQGAGLKKGVWIAYPYRKAFCMSFEVVICTESGYLENLSRFLVFSLRTYGGQHSNVPIYSYSPRAKNKVSQETVRFFEQYQVEYVDLELNTSFLNYPLANKPLACSHREQNSKSKVIVFLDSDVLFLGEPSEFTNLEGADVMLRPVDRKNAGTDDSDSNVDYWDALYSELEITNPRYVTTTVDGRTVREYYNSGHIIKSAETDLFQAWEENFRRVMQARLSPRRGPLFIEQSVFSATVTQMELNVKRLAKEYNFPSHSARGMTNEEYRVSEPNTLISVHYHKSMCSKKRYRSFRETLQDFGEYSHIFPLLEEFGVVQLTPVLVTQLARLMRVFKR